MVDDPREITGNRAIEQAAIEWVIELEARHGRRAVDRRGAPGFPADLESPPRIIEVKAFGRDARGSDLPVEVTQYQKALADPHFYLYIVDNVRQGDPSKFRLKVLGGDRLRALLGRAREARYYEVPVPVATFDAAPGIDALADEPVSVSAPRLEVLAAFLPEFEAPGFELGTWTRSWTDADGVVHLGWYALGPRGRAFVDAVRAGGRVTPEVDWMDWAQTPEGQGLLEDPSRIEAATADELRALLTTIIRSQRFDEGAIADAFERGLLHAIVRRASVLVAQSERTDPGASGSRSGTEAPGTDGPGSGPP